MWLKMRLLVVCLLVGIVSMQSGLVFVSEANAASAMVMPQDCCPDDCADMPDCDAACLAMTECRVAPYAQELPQAVLSGALAAGRSAFLTAPPADPRQIFGEGLQRPPMV